MKPKMKLDKVLKKELEMGPEKVLEPEMKPKLEKGPEKKLEAPVLDKKMELAEQFAERFKERSKVYGGMPFWAWNCKVDSDVARRQIEYFDEMGMGGGLSFIPGRDWDFLIWGRNLWNGCGSV